MTESAAAHPFPPGRYGRRRHPHRTRRRWITYVLATAMIAVGLVIAVKLYRQYAQAPYQVRIITVTDLTDTAVTVTFEVTRPAGKPVHCTVLAHTREGEMVGQAMVTVPAGSATETVSRFTYTLETTQRAVTGEVPGCGPAPG